MTRAFLPQTEVGAGQKAPTSCRGTLLTIKAKAENGLNTAGQAGRQAQFRKAGVGAREMGMAVL